MPLSIPPRRAARPGPRRTGGRLSVPAPGPAWLVALACAASAQTALEPDQAGIDFRIQGEYSGAIGSGAFLGVQVAALGEARFRADFLPGGLPGAGWSGTERFEASGARQGDTAAFSGSGFTAAIAADGASIRGKNAQGIAFTLAKVSRISPTEGAAPPAGALVLFDGEGVSAWESGTATMDARKLFRPEGATASSGAVTRRAFRDFTLHLEFREPFMPAQRGTKRGNSGIYLQGRYEIQVLDSFGSAPAAAGDTLAPKRECGAIWEHFAPKLNMAFPPLSWQTYDIVFTAARFDPSGTRATPARLTLKWNGEVVHEQLDMLNRTLAGDPEGEAPGPLRFQGYGDPVFYRNIWISEGASPIRRGPGKTVKPRARNGSGQAFSWRRPDGRAVDRRLRASGRGPTPAAPESAGHNPFSGPLGYGEVTYPWE